MPGTDALIGQSISHYRILEKLDGVEWVLLERRVALKLLPKDSKDPEPWSALAGSFLFLSPFLDTLFRPTK